MLNDFASLPFMCYYIITVVANAWGVRYLLYVQPTFINGEFNGIWLSSHLEWMAKAYLGCPPASCRFGHIKETILWAIFFL